MKAERRQELKTNDLGAFLLDLQDWARRNAYQLGGGIAVLALVIFGVTFAKRNVANSLDSTWLTMSNLSFTPEEAQASFSTLDNVLQEATDEDLRLQALLRKADAARNLVVAQDGFHPQYLDDEAEAYEALLAEFGDRMPIAGMALSGLATVEENRFVVDGDLAHRDRASEHLERLRDDPMFKGTPFQTQAAKRLQDIDRTFQPITMVPAPEPELTDDTTQTGDAESGDGESADPGPSAGDDAGAYDEPDAAGSMDTPSSADDGSGDGGDATTMPDAAAGDPQRH